MSSRKSTDRKHFGRGQGRNCVTGKKRFRYKQKVVSFLHFAANARKDAAELGATTTHEALRSYRCKECGGYHVTSKPARDAAQLSLVGAR